MRARVNALLVVAATMTACGGGVVDDEEALTLSQASASAACVPPADYQAVSAGWAVRPPLQARDVWHAPWVLRITAGSGVAAHNAPVRVLGPYRVPGEVPSWVCRGDQ